MSEIFKKFAAVLAVFSAAFLLAACGDNDEQSPQKSGENALAQDFDRLQLVSLDLGQASSAGEADEEQKAPELLKLSRKSLKNKDLNLPSGDKAVLFAFFTTWCEPCEVQINVLKALQKKFAPSLRVIGVLVEEKTPEQIAEFIEQKRLNFPVARGAGAFSFMQVLGGFSGIPYAALYDKTGKNRANFTGLVAQEMLEIEIMQASE